jgi:hypothetical protein
MPASADRSCMLCVDGSWHASFRSCLTGARIPLGLSQVDWPRHAYASAVMRRQSLLISLCEVLGVGWVELDLRKRRWVFPAERIKGEIEQTAVSASWHGTVKLTSLSCRKSLDCRRTSRRPVGSAAA